MSDKIATRFLIFLAIVGALTLALASLAARHSQRASIGDTWSRCADQADIDVGYCWRRPEPRHEPAKVACATSTATVDVAHAPWPARVERRAAVSIHRTSPGPSTAADPKPLK